MGLNMNYINFDVLVAKLASGIYQGKCQLIQWFVTGCLKLSCLPEFWSAFCSFLFLFDQTHKFGLFLLGVSTSDLDNLAAETCAYMTIVHPDYSKLAARIVITNLRKRTTDSFLEVATRLYTQIKDKVGRPAPMLADDVYKVI